MGAQGSNTQSQAGAGAATAGAVATATGVGAPVGIGLMAVGTGLSIWGSLSAAGDQANLDQEKAQVAQQQAAEIQSREVANENLKDQQAYRAKLAFGASYAGSGKAGTGIGSQLEIQRQTDQANVITNRESQFQQQMLQEQAGVDTTLAQETQQAGYISAAGSLVGGASKAYGIANAGGNNPGYGGPQSAPNLTAMLNSTPALQQPGFGNQPGV